MIIVQDEKEAHFSNFFLLSYFRQLAWWMRYCNAFLEPRFTNYYRFFAAIFLCHWCPFVRLLKLINLELKLDRGKSTTFASLFYWWKKNVKEEEKKGKRERNSPQAICYFNQHDIYMNSVLFNRIPQGGLERFWKTIINM